MICIGSRCFYCAHEKANLSKVIRQNAVNIDMQDVNLLTENNLVIKGIQYEPPNLSIPRYLKNGQSV